MNIKNIVERMKSLRAGRRNTEYQIDVDDAGILKSWVTLENRKGHDHLPWNDIVSVKVFKRDLGIVDLICMAFETTSDSWFEVHEEMEGWNDLVRVLPTHLKGTLSSEQWWSLVAFPPMKTSEKEILRRSTGKPNQAL